METSRKICIMILIGISIFLVGIFDVKAYENGITGTNLRIGYDNSYNDYASTTTGDYTTFNVTTTNQIRNFSINFKATNQIYIENGVIQVNGYISSIAGLTSVGSLTGATLYLGSNSYACDITNFSQGVNTNDTIINGYSWTANCKIDKGTIQTSITGNAIRLFYNHNSYDNHLLFGLYHILTWNYNGNSEIANNTSDIKNKINEDIDNDSKTPPNQQEYDNAKQQENTIISGISGASPNDITFTQDINATGTIWNLIDNIVNTNAKIIGLIISILSIGLIKLILAR